MHHTSHPAAQLVRGCAVAILLAAATATGLAAQLGAGVARTTRLEVTTRSDAARTQFWAALDDFTSTYNARASERMQAVLALDSTFGLARAVYAATTGTLPRQQREAHYQRAVRDAASGSTGELLVARALQEQFAGNGVNARTLLGTAVELMPADPYVAHLYAVTPGPRIEGARELREVTTRFPDYAPAHRDLALAYWRVGDRAAAVRSATTAMEKAPNNPTTHATTAQIAQWSGRFDEAITHAQKAVELDPEYVAGISVLASAHQLLGHGDATRSTLTRSLDRITTPAARQQLLRGVASSWILQGNATNAITQFGTAAEDAKRTGEASGEALDHLYAAVTDAALGNGRGVATHVGAVQMTGEDVGVRQYWAAVAYAFAKQPDNARRAIQASAAAPGAPGAPPPPAEMQATRNAVVSGILLYNDGKCAEATTELAKANPQNALAQAITALCAQKSGNTVAARNIRDELISNRELSLFAFADVLARQLVKKVT
jgi:tetratricopeptide (TPR) repeat protein